MHPQNPPFNCGDLVRLRHIGHELVVDKCEPTMHGWIVHATEVTQQAPVTVNWQACEYVAVEQIQLFGTWE